MTTQPTDLPVPVHPACREPGTHVSHKIDVIRPIDGERTYEMCPGRDVPSPPVTIEDRLRRQYDKAKRQREQMERHIDPNAIKNPSWLADRALRLAQFEAVMDAVEEIFEDHKEARA